jgi:aspartyl-tRNA synthetase
MKFNKRTHNCSELSLSDIGKIAVLNGWVAKKRDLGGIVFIDLRDRYGLIQIKISPDKKEIYELSLKIGNEFVVSVKGKVIRRESVNLNIPTGEIEIDVDELQILNESSVPPFVVEEDIKANEDLRLQYRYLDLRRKKMMDNLIVRNNVYQIVHKYYTEKGFVEVETPVLMKSTPEGARDYLVPSRVHKGKFYALPQSPQTYKQILMVAGIDKYFQICKCFRDEDLRADRQPEFTQIDVEMSYVDQEDIFSISEGLFRTIWKSAINIDLPEKFAQITYDDALNLYGIDKPDMRIRDIMVINNLSDIFKNSGFKVFSDVVKENGIIAGIKINMNEAAGKIEITRKAVDVYTDFLKKQGFSGLAFLKVQDNNDLSSSILKYLSEIEINALKEKFKLKIGDYVFILSGSANKVLSGLGQLRLKIAGDYKLLDDGKHEFIWVTDFPLFHYEEEENCFVGEHHLFTSPKEEFLHLLDSRKKVDIESIRANCYDLVYNGNEIGSGSIRIHNSEIQKKVFNIIGLNDEEAAQKFGYLLEAFRYGAPPHGGVAFGYDRIIAVLCGTKSIRDVIAFPKTVSAASLMDDCPNNVSNAQLNELGIKIIEDKK